MRLIALIALIEAQTGCGESSCLESKLTISAGVYGRVTYQTDVAPRKNGPEPVEGQLILVTAASDHSLVAMTNSDSDGIFQVELDRAKYELCYSSGEVSCTSFETELAHRVHIDLHTGLGTYWTIEESSDCAD